MALVAVWCWPGMGAEGASEVGLQAQGNSDSTLDARHGFGTGELQVLSLYGGDRDKGRSGLHGLQLPFQEAPCASQAPGEPRLWGPPPSPALT